MSDDRHSVVESFRRCAGQRATCADTQAQCRFPALSQESGCPLGRLHTCSKRSICAFPDGAEERVVAVQGFAAQTWPAAGDGAPVFYQPPVLPGDVRLCVISYVHVSYCFAETGRRSITKNSHVSLKSRCSSISGLTHVKCRRRSAIESRSSFSIVGLAWPQHVQRRRWTAAIASSAAPHCPP